MKLYHSISYTCFDIEIVSNVRLGNLEHTSVFAVPEAKSSNENIMKLELLLFQYLNGNITR